MNVSNGSLCVFGATAARNPHLLLPEKPEISHWNDRQNSRSTVGFEPWDFASALNRRT